MSPLERRERATMATIRVFFAAMCATPLAILLGDRAAVGVMAFLVIGLAVAGRPLVIRSESW